MIVGAGSAGCVLANRLTADGRHRVLLLEAGGEDRDIWIHIPLGYGRHFTNPKVNWLYETEPEGECHGRNIIQPRGKVIGGSSSINGLLYIRGQREDFDHWRQLGNVGWSYDDVLPYFRRAEDQQRGADDLHGEGGPLCVSDMEPLPVCDAFIAAAEQCGYRRNPDFNGAVQEGFGYYQLTTRNGRRCSAAVGYLKPARRRPNLRVVSGALATRVLFDGRRAAGIEYRDAGGMHAAQRARGDPFGRHLQHARNCCSSPGSVPHRCCNSMASRSSPTCRVSAPTCRTITMPAWSIAARSRSRSTTCSPASGAASWPD